MLYTIRDHFIYKSECTKKMKNMRCDLLAVRDSISFPYYLSKVTISVY